MLRIFVPPRPPERTTGEPETDQSLLARYAVPEVPPAILERHGARVLRPSEAVTSGAGTQYAPTIYRSDALLLPPVENRSTMLDDLSFLLTEIGLKLEEPADRAAPSTFIEALLAPIDPSRAEPVDAWTVLGKLRAGAARADSKSAEEVRGAVDSMTLDHLLVGSALDGAGSGLFASGNTASNGSPYLGDLFDRPQAGLSGRIPVTVLMRAPEFPPHDPDRRRVVVAVLDTGIAPHPWLPYAERGSDKAHAPVVIVDPELQGSIERQATGNRRPRAPIHGYTDVPFIEEPLRGELYSYAGHGTYIAGIIRQLAPAAHIYAVRIMQPYGFAHESDLLLALERIARGVRLAYDDPDQEGAQMVDIVSLSLGYFHESAEEARVTALLTPALRALTELGVTVVAAAGNFSTSREFYPAALAEQFREDDDAAPLISVGSLNPNGSTSRFSNEASWVSCYASGAAVVSAFPPYAGSVNPGVTVGRRQTFDPDDFRGGFAVWSGCSFATPGIAGCLAQELADRRAEQDRYVDKQPLRIEEAREAWRSVRQDPQYTPPPAEQS